MKITEYMDVSLIHKQVQAQEKTQAIFELINLLKENDTLISKDEIFEKVMERERLSSTGIGSGIALPHVKIKNLEKNILFFGRSHSGIDFDAIDEKPVHLMFLLLSPEKENENHLRTLARISRMLHDTSFRENLNCAKSSNEIYDVIVKKDAEYKS